MKKKYIPVKVRRDVLVRDGNRCRYCGEYVDKYHLDHVYPESKGGETTVENLVIACPTCNHNKHATIGIWPSEPKLI